MPRLPQCKDHRIVLRPANPVPLCPCSPFFLYHSSPVPRTEIAPLQFLPLAAQFVRPRSTSHIVRLPCAHAPHGMLPAGAPWHCVR
eukprot:scaffold127526_cov19-Tisochrysis_lutea.AAC.4